MTVCAVFDEQTGELVNTIIAEVTDPPPEGCFLVYWPENTYWDGEKFVEYPPDPPDPPDPQPVEGE